jgi:hypothetical protein
MNLRRFFRVRTPHSSAANLFRDNFMKRDDQDKLLRETLTGEELSDFRKASLAGGLASVRRRRRYRRAAQATAVLVLTLLVSLGIVHEHRNRAPVREVASIKRTSATPAPSPAPSTEAAKVKTISDEELFALFPGRAMALVGKPGEQQFVFLDGGAPRAMAQ